MENPKLFLTINVPMRPLGEVTGSTCCYRVYLVHVELMQTYPFCAGSFRWKNPVTTTKVDILQKDIHTTLSYAYQIPKD